MANVETRYNIGDTVYVPSVVPGKTGKIVCPHCSGTGKIDVTIEHIRPQPIQVICPACQPKEDGGTGKYRKYCNYNVYEPRLITIDEILVDIGKDKTSIHYYTPKLSTPFSESDVFQGKQSCLEYCNKLNQEAKEAAQTFVYRGK